METLAFPRIEIPAEHTYSDFLKQKINIDNARTGSLGGYNCDICKNKGFIAFEDDGYERFRECSCMQIRETLRRINDSGLSELFRTNTFKSFETTEQFQECIKRSAIEFTKQKSGFFIVCGQSGSGKTHICTAIVGGLIKQGLSARYLVWREDAGILKSHAADTEYYQIIKQYKETDVLYIDDLFKTKDISDISGADIKLAFELIDYRCRNDLITIISSEWTMEQLRSIDEAIAGRIAEKAKGSIFVINKDPKKNYRFRG